MGKPYSSDLRIRVVQAVERGMSARSAAERFGVSISSGIRWSRQFRADGRVEGIVRRGRRASRLDPHADWLLALIVEQSDITLEEVRALLLERGTPASVGLVWSFYDHYGISFKKSGSRRRTGSGGRGRGKGRVEEEPASA